MFPTRGTIAGIIQSQDQNQDWRHRRRRRCLLTILFTEAAILQKKKKKTHRAAK